MFQTTLLELSWNWTKPKIIPMLTVDANSFIHCEGKGDLMAVANQQRPGSKQLMVCMCQARLSSTPHIGSINWAK